MDRFFILLPIFIFLLATWADEIGIKLGVPTGTFTTVGEVALSIWTFFLLKRHLAGKYKLLLMIPLGIGMRFIAFAPQWNRWSSLLFTSVAILFFTAWPEELLFRGLLQNFLTRASKNDLAGWWTASVFFGLSHITNMGFPNWRYVILATIAGIFYGWTWRKSGSIFASALVHAAVDAVWHFLFRTG